MFKAAVNMYFVKLATELGPDGSTVIVFHLVSQNRHKRRHGWSSGDIPGGIRGKDVSRQGIYRRAAGALQTG